MGKKKKKYISPKIDQKVLEDFREHLKLMNEKSKAISEKYQKWWDSENKKWKDGFAGHDAHNKEKN